MAKRDITFNLQLVDNATGELKNITVEARNAQEALRNIGKAASEGARRMSAALTTTALQATNQALQGVRAAVDSVAASYMSFDKSMRAVNTMAGKGREEFAQLTAAVSELGKTIPLTREQLASGLYQVISNGVPEDNWLTFLEQSAKASVGGIAELGEAVTVTSTLIKNYGLGWDAVGTIQDKIQTTAKNGVTSFEQLAQALPRVSGTAAQLGVSVDELMAVFATCTGVTGNTAEVSTQLAAVFKALVKPSKQAQKAAQDMGIAFDAAAIQSAGGLDTFLKQLDKDVADYAARTGQLSQSIYAQLFGSAEALRVLGALSGEQADVFTGNVGAMANSAGAIENAFGQMASTGEAGSIMFRNSMAAVTDWAGSVAQAVSPVTTFMTSVGGSVITLLQLKSGVTVAAAAIQKAGLITKAYTAIQAALNVVMSANPISLVILGIGALVAAFRAAYVNCEPFRVFVDKLWSKFKEGLKVCADIAKAVWDKVVKAFEAASAVIKKAWDWVKKFFGITGKESAEAVATTIAASTVQPVVTILDAEVEGDDDTITLSTAKPVKINNPAGEAWQFQTLDDFTNRIAYLEDIAKTAAQEEYIAIKAQLEQVKRLKDIFTGESKTTTWAELQAGRTTSVARVSSAPLSTIPTPKGTMPQTIRNPLPAKEIVKDSIKVQDAISGIADVLGNLSGALASSAGSWLTYASNVLAAIARMIPALLAVTMAEGAESSQKLPFPANIIALGASMAAVAAAFASLPKFADGGIAYGPTLGIFGEYSGAANNPEVVAPLNKLQAIINTGDNGGGNVRFRIEGRDLVGVLAKYNKFTSRI